MFVIIVQPFPLFHHLLNKRHNTMLKPTLITFFAFLGWYSHAQRITSEDVQLEKADTKNLGYRQLSGKVEMRANTGNIETFMIDSGAGSKQLRSTDGNEIIVKAVIELSTNNSDKAGEIIDENLTLELKKDGDKVTLTSLFDFDKGGNNVTKGSFLKHRSDVSTSKFTFPKGFLSS